VCVLCAAYFCARGRMNYVCTVCENADVSIVFVLECCCASQAQPHSTHCRRPQGPSTLGARDTAGWLLLLCVCVCVCECCWLAAWLAASLLPASPPPLSRVVGRPQHRSRLAAATAAYADQGTELTVTSTCKLTGCHSDNCTAAANMGTSSAGRLAVAVAYAPSAGRLPHAGCCCCCRSHRSSVTALR
jgi:hypothetical protein